MVIWLTLGLLSATVWLLLLGAHHGFWRAQPRLEKAGPSPGPWPHIAAIIPARDEADVIETSVRSLLNQDYPGRLDIIVVDDQSSDGTGEIVRQVMEGGDLSDRLTLLRSGDRPQGWSGKLWAIESGLHHLSTRGDEPTFLLLTDADIKHDPGSLSELFQEMVNGDRDLVSIMVRLRTHGLWERWLIPPFVFFFQMLFPFPAVNRPDRRMAAAAGGCVLVRREALLDAGGIAAIKGALIDDVALADLVKARPNGRRRIWLGHGERTVSLRAYDGLGSIWAMVARTADTQLGHSFVMLAMTLFGMTLLYMLPPLLVLSWPVHGDQAIAIVGLAAWLLMAWAYMPTLRLYGQSFLWAPTLPVAALLYTAMTVDSARLYRLGKGGQWKGRTLAHPSDSRL